MRAWKIAALDVNALAELRERRIDHGGNVVVPFVDDEGGWPLRCCLTDSVRGDEIEIVAWSPFEEKGPYAELGPVVVHAGPCSGSDGSRRPAQFEARRQLLRPYGHDGRIVYDSIKIVEPGQGLWTTVDTLMADPAIAFIHARNVLAGCFSFAIEPS